MQDKYPKIFNNFCFKKLFGEESHKDLLIHFLNAFLPQAWQIQELQYIKQGYRRYTPFDASVVFDLACTSTTGERFIVELLKSRWNFSSARSSHELTFPIQEQAENGELDCQQRPVYVIGLFDFIFAADRGMSEVVHTQPFYCQHARYDQLTFIYLVLPHFDKTLADLQTTQDKWLYIFRHLPDIQTPPSQFQEAVFLKLFEVAQIDRFDPTERQIYESCLRNDRDWKCMIEAAQEEGRRRARVKLEKEAM